ncbi:SMI1/KNR4 family protein [Streptomyces sp. NPDC017940]|uniref:SMI1/KNR4 family protein n=1 Tax=Streptomyces sp. NPDC017940 TaxID=3365017 RepID=UPI003793392B
METSISKLLAISGEPLASAGANKPDRASGRLGGELTELLQCANGFYAFESALHVYPACSGSGVLSQEDWNDAQLWRAGYGGMADGYLFFAEDAFGGQFGIKGETIFAFDPETGEVSPFAASLEEWASRLLADFEVETGFPLMHEWQSQKGQLQQGLRLLPKRPFVLGGDYSVDNLYALDAVKGMRLRADLAVQIRDLPDGAVIKYSVSD